MTPRQPRNPAGLYKHVALGLIFLKYISDAFEEHRQWLLKEAADPKSEYYVREREARYRTVEDRDVNFSHFRLTAGAGLRITIPMMGPAPIALDWGVPIVKEPFDSTRIFSFSVGFTR